MEQSPVTKEAFLFVIARMNMGPTHLRHIGIIVVLLGVWGTGPAPGAEATHPVPQDSLVLRPAEPIDEVRVDADGDAVPDRVGDTVAVMGRVTAGRGQLPVPIPELIALQDSTARIHAILPEGPNVERGDSVRIRGRVAHRYGLAQLHRYGLAQLQALDYRILDHESSIPSPIPLTVPAVTGETYEGQLVRIRGRVVTAGTNDGGKYLILGDREEETRSQITVFVGNRHVGRVNVDEFDENDEVQVTGILGQHDYDAPFTDYYQVQPRKADDLVHIGLASTYLPIAVAVILGEERSPS